MQILTMSRSLSFCLISTLASLFRSHLRESFAGLWLRGKCTVSCLALLGSSSDYTDIGTGPKTPLNRQMLRFGEQASETK